jgi:multicomponent Na+:H+ antiporter subunit F
VFLAATVAILITIALAIVRGLLGPTVYDRILAVNMIGTKTVLLISVITVSIGRTDFLDIAMVYALINFIGTLAVLKVFESGDLGSGPDPEGEPES